MATGEREHVGEAVTFGGDRSRDTSRESYAESDLVEAMRMGPQDDPVTEGDRQFRIGYAAGVLGLVRFRTVLRTAKMDMMEP